MVGIIDSHAHVVTADIASFPPSRADDPAISAILDRNFDAIELLRRMDDSGVAQALVVQRGQVYGSDNRYICTAAQEQRGRLHPVCAIDARIEDCAAAAEEWHKNGAVGFRLMARIGETGFEWLDGAYAATLWRAVADMGLPMCVHFFAHAREEGIARLSAILDRLPIQVVIDHLSNPRIESAVVAGIDPAIERLADNPGVTLKFTTIPLAGLEAAGMDTEAIVERYIALFGADRLMWGSDVTQSPGEYADMIAMAHRATEGLDTDVKQQLLAGTAARVYRLPA